MDILTLGKEPLEGDKPTGIDVRYEPEFEILQTEIDKLGSPTSSGQVDWRQIVKTSVHILSLQSKDLTVASYLAVGLVYTEQVSGLDQGLQVLKDLVENFWDQLYPSKKRMRGRLGALTWWMDKTESMLGKLDSKKPFPAELVQRILDNFKALDQILVDKMPEPPMLRPVQRIVERLEVEQDDIQEELSEAPAQATTPTPAAPEAPSAPTSQTKAAAPAAAEKKPEAITNANEASRAVAADLQNIRKASGVLLKSDLKNPLPYRLRRMAAWAKVDALPPHQDGCTQIPAPGAQVLDSFVQLQETGNTQGFIETVEQKLSQFIFWIDLNRLTAEALSDLGTKHQRALSAVCQETAGLLHRLPGLEALSFSDGTAFADGETRNWLQGLGGKPAGGTGGGMQTGSTAEDDQIQVKLQEAKAMARKKQLLEGVNLLQKHMRRSESRCMQMRWRLAIIEVLLSVKKYQLALPHAEQVLDDIETFRLEVWDPNLALEGLHTAWQTFSSQNTNEHKSQAGQLVQRIASIDSVAALRMQP